MEMTLLKGPITLNKSPILRLRKATTVDNSAISIKTSCLIRDFKSGKLTPDAQQAGNREKRNNQQANDGNDNGGENKQQSTAMELQFLLTN